jgi:hypothetical protein
VIKVYLDPIRKLITTILLNHTYYTEFILNIKIFIKTYFANVPMGDGVKYRPIGRYTILIIIWHYAACNTHNV